MRLVWWERGKDWVWARWTAPQRVKLLAAAFANQSERLREVNAELERRETLIVKLRAEGSPRESSLAPEEIERLAVLGAECGELIQFACKVLLHGWDGASPFNGKPNQVQVEREAGDVLAAIDAMVQAGELRWREVAAWRGKKAAVGQKWMHHQ